MKKKTKVQMRRAIARDVIKQLDIGLLVPTKGTYVGKLGGDAVALGVNYGDSLQPYLLRTERRPCQVCGIGAAVVAQIRLENEVTLGNLPCVNPYLLICKYFTNQQVHVLESLFEMWDGISITTTRLRAIPPADRLRFLYSYVAKNPRFTGDEIRAAALRYGNAQRKKTHDN